MTILVPLTPASEARLLDVVNNMLGTVGESPVEAIEDAHAYKDAILGMIYRVSKNLQARGWWFNKDSATLEPSSLTDEIEIPGDALGVYAADPSYVQRGAVLMDKRTGSTEFAAPVSVCLVREVPIEDLPQLAFDAIAAESVYRFQRNYDGDSTKTRDLRAERDTALADLRDEDTRQTRANMIFANPQLRKIAVLAQRLAR